MSKNRSIRVGQVITSKEFPEMKGTRFNFRIDKIESLPAMRDGKRRYRLTEFSIDELEGDRTLDFAVDARSSKEIIAGIEWEETT
jgi:hypothetical protein